MVRSALPGLSFGHGPEADPLENLEDYLDTLERGPVVVIDDRFCVGQEPHAAD
ncbi:hypothetical protein [Streptomyces sp. NPDC048256]|uniref:hypothetical protein n=1 Tax=unclassified Streptomyces TaxID=2593676 RepID=UPI0033C773FE